VFFHLGLSYSFFGHLFNYAYESYGFFLSYIDISEGSFSKFLYKIKILYFYLPMVFHSKLFFDGHSCYFLVEKIFRKCWFCTHRLCRALELFFLFKLKIRKLAMNLIFSGYLIFWFVLRALDGTHYWRCILVVGMWRCWKLWFF
jgi:hypothetical protein